MQMCNSEIIKKRIDLLLFELDKKRNDLAKFVGFDESTLSKKMNGYVEWKLSECVAVANFFSKTIEEIFLPS